MNRSCTARGAQPGASLGLALLPMRLEISLRIGRGNARVLRDLESDQDHHPLPGPPVERRSRASRGADHRCVVADRALSRRAADPDGIQRQRDHSGREEGTRGRRRSSSGCGDFRLRYSKPAGLELHRRRRRADTAKPSGEGSPRLRIASGESRSVSELFETAFHVVDLDPAPTVSGEAGLAPPTSFVDLIEMMVEQDLRELTAGHVGATP